MAILLDSKLEIPTPRAEVVVRPRLYKMLDTDSDQLVVVSAPAGSGKSTLLAQWAGTETAHPAGWLSMDNADNDPTRFCIHMVGALRRLNPDVGERALAALGAPGVELFDVVLPMIVDDLRREAVAGTLILDDYHLVDNPEIHRAMSFFLDHRPDQLRVVISSRTEPPLQLATRRVRGQLRELVTADLRFTTEEADEFLNHSLGLDLAYDDVCRLSDCTEGWTAGVYLAALTLREREDRLGFIEDFESGHRHVTDFLASEVMPRLSDDMQTFMLRTSILDRFSADLANTVTGRNDAAQMLREIERSNLFLIPLDDRREWFRYHHLFAELLRGELVASETESSPELHRSAAHWYRDHGFPAEAVEHAFAAEDTLLVNDLVARNWIVFEMTGQVHTAIGWFERLTDDVIRSDARLALAMGQTLTHLGRLNEAEEWIQAAEAVEAPIPPTDGTASIESSAAIARALRFHFQGDFPTAVEHSEVAVGLEPMTSPWRAIALLALGGSRYWLGDRVEADRALHEAVSVGTERNMHLAVILAQGYLALAAFDEGRRVDAERLAREALRVAAANAATEYSEALMAQVVLAKVHEKDGDLATAQTHAARAVLLGRRAGWPIQLAFAQMAKASIEHRRGERSTASRLVAEAQQLLANAPNPGVLGHMLTTVERRLGVSRLTKQRDGGFTEALTNREMAVMQLLPSSLTFREIADELYVSLNTVKSHNRAIYRKLGVTDRSSAVDRARSIGIL